MYLVSSKISDLKAKSQKVKDLHKNEVDFQKTVKEKYEQLEKHRQIGLFYEDMLKIKNYQSKIMTIFRQLKEDIKKVRMN